MATAVTSHCCYCHGMRCGIACNQLANMDLSHGRLLLPQTKNGDGRPIRTSKTPVLSIAGRVSAFALVWTGCTGLSDKMVSHSVTTKLTDNSQETPPSIESRQSTAAHVSFSLFCEAPSGGKPFKGPSGPNVENRTLTERYRKLNLNEKSNFRKTGGL